MRHPTTFRKFSTLSALLLGSSTVVAKNRVITVVNNCDYTVWPAIFRSVGPKPSQKTGWEAKPGSRVGFEVEESWGGRVWGRTGCDFTSDKPDYQQCETGGCNGGLECDPDTGTGVLPVTLAEFNIQTNIDHYDTSNVDGFNIPMAVTNDADCPLSNCPYDLRDTCPDDLQYKNDEGKVVGCLTDCGAHQQNEEYCCFGAHQLPADCPASAIPNYPWWKKNCPIAYAYAYDESSGTALFTCEKQVNWMITFCPGPELYSSTALLPNGTEITQGGDYPDYPKGTAKDGGGAPDKAENSEGSASPPGSSSGGSSGGGSTSTGDTTTPASSGGSGGGNSTPIASGGGGGGASSSGSTKTGSSAASSPTGSGSSSSGSSSSGSSSSTSDDTLLGFPAMYVYAAFGVVALLIIGGLVYALMSKKKKKHGHHKEQSDSGSSDAGSSTPPDTETETESSDEYEKGKKRSSRALAKLDRMEQEEKMAMDQKFYGGGEERRLFSMGKGRSSSESDGGYSSDESVSARKNLARRT